MVLVDVTSNSDCVDASECVARGLKVEAEDQPEEHKMANGSVIKTEGRIQVNLKNGRY